MAVGLYFEDENIGEFVLENELDKIGELMDFLGDDKYNKYETIVVFSFFDGFRQVQMREKFETRLEGSEPKIIHIIINESFANYGGDLAGDGMKVGYERKFISPSNSIEEIKQYYQEHSRLNLA